MSQPARVAALVPAKSFARAKSRLSSVLDEPERAALAERLLRHVVDTLQQSAALSDLWVLTDDDAVAELARKLGCETTADQGQTLDAIVDAGLHQAQAAGARAALVCMADLPALQPTEVRAAVAALQEHEVVLVGDAYGRGTNLLGLRPPTCIPTRFGSADSFAQHMDEARNAGLDALALELPGAQRDLDVPADLKLAAWLR